MLFTTCNKKVYIRFLWTVVCFLGTIFLKSFEHSFKNQSKLLTTYNQTYFYLKPGNVPSSRNYLIQTQLIFNHLPKILSGVYFTICLCDQLFTVIYTNWSLHHRLCGTQLVDPCVPFLITFASKLNPTKFSSCWKPCETRTTCNNSMGCSGLFNYWPKACLLECLYSWMTRQLNNPIWEFDYSRVLGLFLMNFLEFVFPVRWFN